MRQWSVSWGLVVSTHTQTCLPLPLHLPLVSGSLSWGGSWWGMVKVKVAQSCPTLCKLMDCKPWNSPGQNTGVGSLFRLQGIFPTQRSNSGLPNCRWILNQLSHKGSPWGYSGCHDYPRVGTSSFSPSRGQACCCTLGVTHPWWVQAAGLWGGGVDTPHPTSSWSHCMDPAAGGWRCW